VNIPVTFDGGRSIDTPSDYPNLQYEWDFDSQNTIYSSYDPMAKDATGKIVTNTYSTPGIYYVTLTVMDDDGVMDNDTITLIAKQRNVQIDIGLAQKDVRAGDFAVFNITVTNVGSEEDTINLWTGMPTGMPELVALTREYQPAGFAVLDRYVVTLAPGETTVVTLTVQTSEFRSLPDNEYEVLVFAESLEGFIETGLRTTDSGLVTVNISIPSSEPSVGITSILGEKAEGHELTFVAEWSGVNVRHIEGQ